MERIDRFKPAIINTKMWSFLFDYICNLLFQLISSVKRYSVEMRTILVLDVGNISQYFAMINNNLQSLVESCWFTEEKMEEWIMNNLEKLPKACLMNRLQENANLSVKFKKKMSNFLL